MKKVILIMKIVSRIILIIILCDACCLVRHNTTTTARRIPLPDPDPIDVQGDSLYAIYRKGLITRHITTNGRLLVTSALESIDDFDLEEYDSSGIIKVKRTDGTVIRSIPIDNIRYSEELIPGTHNVKDYVWVPVVAPIKNPGYSNDGYNVASGASDNPLYYGGMALAVFSLEHKYNVSPYSIIYARRLVEYFLASEMTGQNGYLIRRPNFFSYYTRNREGEPIIQGASAEEILGFMLGIMYYLREEDPSYELYIKAKALRDRVLSRINLPYTFQCTYPSGGGYEHDLMISYNNPSYNVGHFAFPIFASAGILLTCPAGSPSYCCGMDDFFINFADASAGASANIADVFENIYDSYAMFLTASILILDGDIHLSSKKRYAEKFMEEFIKAATTNGPYQEDAEYNAYMGIVAKLANKYLNNDLNSEIEGTKLRNIWDDDMATWDDLKWVVDFMIAQPKSLYNKEWEFDFSGNQYQWQHNLPLWRPKTSSGGQISANIWKDHNPHNRIGAWFSWKDPKPYHFVKRDYKWYAEFPGWDADNAMNEQEYKASSSKKYKNYLQEEIVEARGHHDNQVEAVGLDLLFLRMVLTNINPEEYPSPILPNGYNKMFKLLPWQGVEPSHPQNMYYQFRFWSRDDNPGIEPFKIGSDPDKGLSILKLYDNNVGCSNFAVVYADEDDLLNVRTGFVSDGFNVGRETFPADVYLSSQVDVRGKFDEVKIARTEDNSGNEYIVIAERAEYSGICLPCCDHWLRLSLWRVSGFAEGHTGNISRICRWEQSEDSRHCGSVEELDMAIFSQKYIAVSFLTNQDREKLMVFEIDFQNGEIKDIMNKTVSSALFNNSNSITTAYNDMIIFQEQFEDGWRIASHKWTGSTTEFKHNTGQKRTERVLDLQIIKKADYSQPDYIGSCYVIAVTEDEGRLGLWSWEVDRDGKFDYRGMLDLREGEKYLLGREVGWELASISPFYWLGRPGFVIAGKGVARVVKNDDGDWAESDKSLKLLYGYILEDGRPTIESSSVIGSGDDSAVEMVDVTGGINYDGENRGVLIAHKTKDNHLMITFWDFNDKFKNTRWNNE